MSNVYEGFVLGTYGFFINADALFGLAHGFFIVAGAIYRFADAFFRFAGAFFMVAHGFFMFADGLFIVAGGRFMFAATGSMVALCLFISVCGLATGELPHLMRNRGGYFKVSEIFISTEEYAAVVNR